MDDICLLKDHVKVMIWNVTGSLISYTMSAKDREIGGVDASIYDKICVTLKRAKEDLEAIEKLLDEQE